mmetsp:Transcript_17661/g.50591  ORF Transcript_17661/g.50591 Transcript_17661/m.50591 type:complete len:340 (-) Transcript_17661:1442-2461(-)
MPPGNVAEDRFGTQIQKGFPNLDGGGGGGGGGGIGGGGLGRGGGAPVVLLRLGHLDEAGRNVPHGQRPLPLDGHDGRMAAHGRQDLHRSPLLDDAKGVGRLPQRHGRQGGAAVLLDGGIGPVPPHRPHYGRQDRGRFGIAVGRTETEVGLDLVVAAQVAEEAEGGRGEGSALPGLGLFVLILFFFPSAIAIGIGHTLRQRHPGTPQHPDGHQGLDDLVVDRQGPGRRQGRAGQFRITATPPQGQGRHLVQHRHDATAVEFQDVVVGRADGHVGGREGPAASPGSIGRGRRRTKVVESAQHGEQLAICGHCRRNDIVVDDHHLWPPIRRRPSLRLGQIGQ